MQSTHTFRFFLSLLIIAVSWTACSKKVGAPGPLNASSTGKLARYDLATEDYDVLPVTTFTYSYDANNNTTNVFEKSGQTLTSFALSYNGSTLGQVTDNTLGVQHFSYDNNGRLNRIDFTTLTDTGKRIYSYDNTGLLTAVVDSVKKPNQLPIITQYLFTYTNGNVTLITQNSLDLEGRPTLTQLSYYTFDDKSNPFVAAPWQRDATLLPAGLASLVNKNNIVQTRLVGTIIQTSGGSTVSEFDTISNYVSSRQYTYNAKGFPVTCKEAFQDLQYNYSGNRSFTYDY